MCKAPSESSEEKRWDGGIAFWDLVQFFCFLPSCLDDLPASEKFLFLFQNYKEYWSSSPWKLEAVISGMKLSGNQNGINTWQVNFIFSFCGHNLHSPDKLSQTQNILIFCSWKDWDMNLKKRKKKRNEEKFPELPISFAIIISSKDSWTLPGAPGSGGGDAVCSLSSAGNFKSACLFSWDSRVIMSTSPILFSIISWLRPLSARTQTIGHPNSWMLSLFCLKIGTEGLPDSLYSKKPGDALGAGGREGDKDRVVAAENLHTSQHHFHQLESLLRV